MKRTSGSNYFRGWQRTGNEKENFIFFGPFKFYDGSEVAITHKKIKPNLAINDK
jgi:hypothetical protein